MGGLRVPAGEKGQPRDRVLVDAHQSSGLADAAPLGEMLQYCQDLVVRQLGVEERGPLELVEAVLTNLAVEEPVAGLAEKIEDQEIILATPAIELAFGVLAAETGEFVRGHDASGVDPATGFSSWTVIVTIGMISLNYLQTLPGFDKNSKQISKLGMSCSINIRSDSNKVY